MMNFLIVLYLYNRKHINFSRLQSEKTDFLTSYLWPLRHFWLSLSDLSYYTAPAIGNYEKILKTQIVQKGPSLSVYLTLDVQVRNIVMQ